MAEQPEERKEEKEEKRGYPWDWLEDPKEGRQFECAECHLLARDICEMTCSEHDDDEVLMEIQYCQSCLVSLLASNGNLCPISKHRNPKYDKVRKARITIANLHSRCPRAVALANSKKG